MIDALCLLPSSADLPAVAASATVVLDTNVLLCPYRLQPELADEFIQHLRALSERLFIPYRVAFEFERRRGEVMRDQDASVDRLVSEVRSALRSATKMLHQQHRYFPRKEAETYLSAMGTKLANDVAVLRQQSDPLRSSVRDRIVNDPISRSLSSILASHIAPSYLFDEQVIGICRARYAGQRPPGTSDSHKEEPDCYGDAMIWLEVLELARSLARRPSPLVLVTADQKDDWWQYEASWRKSPRLELLEELADTGLKTFSMLTPREFLKASGTVTSQALEDALRAVER